MVTYLNRFVFSVSFMLLILLKSLEEGWAYCFLLLHWRTPVDHLWYKTFYKMCYFSRTIIFNLRAVCRNVNIDLKIITFNYAFFFFVLHLLRKNTLGLFIVYVLTLKITLIFNTNPLTRLLYKYFWFCSFLRNIISMWYISENTLRMTVWLFWCVPLFQKIPLTIKVENKALQVTIEQK